MLALGIALQLAAGCRKKEIMPREIRAVSREFVFAAKNSTGGRAEIGMRPETPPRKNPAKGSVEAPEIVAEHIYITLPATRSGETDAAALAALEAELDRVAAAHRLTRQAQPGAPGRVRFDYIWGSGATTRRTHTIHIITPLVASPSTSPKAGAQGGARLAIIIDDLGYERGAADALFALRFPLTASVLPNLPLSADIAEEAHRRGYQVMLHLPMESTNGDAKPEAIELRTAMDAGEVRRVLVAMLDTVPHTVGVNNHQGSLATADARLMAVLMPLLAEREMFFVDSRTTAATVAYDAAVHAHVKAASRNVFLDDVQTFDAIRKQLALAVREARTRGAAVAIGHPHPITLEVFERYLPDFEAHGVHLVFASELVR